MMAEQQAPEQEKKLVTVLSKIDMIQSKNTYNALINDKKDRFIQLSRNSLFDLALYAKYTKDIENELFSLMEDGLTDDLYDTVEWEKVKNYIRFSKNIFIKQEVIMHSLFDFVSEVMDIINESAKLPIQTQFSPNDDGEPKLTDEERNELKRRVYQDILYYKEGSNVKKKIWLNNIRKKANTQEKLRIIDDLFFEIVGERKLSQALNEEKKKKEADAK